MEQTARSRRSGYRETVLLRVLGRGPWRCRNCGLRFNAPSEPEVESRRGHHTLAGYLGILLALVAALGLLRYCAAPTRPPESEGGPSATVMRSGVG
jgi:hypothetical protein